MERAMVRIRSAVCGVVACMLAAAAAPIHGHHSFAMFDTGAQVTLTGVVTAFEWTNPHAYIEMDVPDGRGTKHWTIELGSTSILMRGGWKFSTLKAGDKVTAVVNPLRNGEPGSLLSRITLADGRVLGNGGPPPAAGGAPARGAAPANPTPQK
jgi:hypothetical protein